jgi:hypothetical protein
MTRPLTWRNGTGDTHHGAYGGYNILYKSFLVWFIFIYIFLFIHPFVSHYCWLYPHYIPINSHEMTHKWPTHFGPTWRPGGPWRLRFWPSRGASRAPVWAKSAGAAENRRGARTSCWGCWGWAPAHLRQVSWDFDLETDTMFHPTEKNGRLVGYTKFSKFKPKSTSLASTTSKMEDRTMIHLWVYFGRPPMLEEWVVKVSRTPCLK